MAEYHRMAELGILHPDDRVELIDGDIVLKSRISPDHAETTSLLAQEFITRLGAAAQVRSQGPVQLDAYSEPEPDASLLRRRGDGYRSAHPLPPDILLLVEVADSSLEFDQGKKIPLYAASGIPESWLVDLTRRAIVSHRKPSASGYSEVRSYGRGESLAPEAFPDCVIAVTDIVGGA